MYSHLIKGDYYPVYGMVLLFSESFLSVIYKIYENTISGNVYMVYNLFLKNNFHTNIPYMNNMIHKI